MKSNTQISGGNAASPTAKPTGTLLGIQYLRALGALMVVWEHAQQQVLRHGRGDLGTTFDIGPAGVDVFLVISGFVVFYTTQGRVTRGLDFLIKRFLRIAPLYWLYTAAFLAVFWIAPAALHSFVFDPAHVVKSFLFIPAFHPHHTQFLWPALTPGWVLNYQMFFYVVFAALLGLAPRFRLPALTLSILSLVAAGFVLAPDSAPAVAYTDSLLLEFLGGALVAWWFVSARRIAPGLALGCIAGAILLFGVAEFRGDVINSGNPNRVLMWGLPALLLVAGTAWLERSVRWPRLRFGLTLGDASYSTYLSHYFTLVACSLAWTRLGLSERLPDWIFLAVGIVASHAVGIAAYAVSERPLGERLTSIYRRVAPRSRPSSALPGECLRP